MISLLLFYLFYIAGTGIHAYGDEFFRDYHVEDATFSTYMEIPDEEIGNLENAYDLILEKEHFVNSEEEDYTARVFVKNRKIDQYQVIDGRDLQGRDEILLSAGYAENCGVKTGDRIRLQGRDYRVAGTFLRPDYLYMLENLTDDYKNVSSFFLAYLDEEEFQDQFGNGTTDYKVIYHDRDRIRDFRKKINEDYITASYIDADENVRISFVYEQADMFLLSAWVMLFILPFITVALISILIGRKIRSDQKVIGTLSAMGYKKSSLMRHYSLIAVIPGLLGGLLTAAAALILAQPFGSLGLADYEPMQATFRLPVRIALAGIVIPTLIYYLCAMLRVWKLLQRDTVELLSGMAGNGGKNRRMLARRSMPVRMKFALRTLAASPGRTFVIFLGIFLGAMIIAFGYTFIDSVRAVGDTAHGEFGSFRYEYIMNTLEQDAPEEGETALIMPYENSDGKSVSLIGMDPENRLWNLTDVEGQRADLNRGWYMSTLCAEIFGLKEGDSFTFRNISTLKSYTVTIDGVIKNGYQCYLISSPEHMAEVTGMDTGIYNAILSDRSLNLDSTKVSEIITDATYENQMENMLQSMSAVVYALIILGMIICIASLYATVNMMLSEQSANISMLKVLGFRNRRIHGMVIDSNHFLLIPGIVTGILAAYGIMVWYCAEFVEVERIVIPVTLTLRSILITIALTAASYFFSLILLRRKVEKTDLVESLKDHRE